MNNTQKNTRPQLNFLEKFNVLETAVMAGNMTTGEKIALRPVVENLGLSWSSQLKRIKRNSQEGQMWSQEKFRADDGKLYDMICMDPYNFQNWLYGLNVSENLNVELWEKYKQGLVIQLLMMLKISLDEIERLRTIQAKYVTLKYEFHRYIEESDKGREYNSMAREKRKESNQIKERILDLLNQSEEQYKLQLN